MRFPRLSGRVVLAPMAGVTDAAFRHICREYGASLAYTEFISSAALSRGGEKIRRMLRIINEKPSACQIFGSNEKELLKAAETLEKDFDIIDINLGCPADKVVRTGSGSSLLKDEKKVERILRTIIPSLKKPVTIKTRLGFKSVNIFEIVKIAEKAGVAAVTVHGRLASQGYNVRADWDTIKKVKANSSLPIIGNGDIDSPEKAMEKLYESNVDYIMVGRAAIGNPYIFRQINDYLKNGEYDKYEAAGKIKDFFRYVALAEKLDLSLPRIRNQAVFFSKGIRNSAIIRKKLSAAKTLEDIKSLFKLINH